MVHQRRKYALIGLAVVVLAIVAGLVLRGRAAEVRYVTATVDRGDILDVVGATGTLQAVTTVQVGSQVSGTIESLYTDFNSLVRKGQVLARLDPSLFQARLGQAQAGLVSAQANVERARATVEDARQKMARAEKLFAEQLLPQADLETTRATNAEAVAALKGSQAAVTQAAANVRQAQVDMQHTVITAPIDGVVIARNVDVGQTVAASLSAPVLFVIANDLSRLQVSASIDEADVGRVRAGQEATFRVDAFPNEVFTGTVEQVRLQPVTLQNVVISSAPRIRAASSRFSSIPSRRASTTTTTNEMQKATWAIVMVVTPSGNLSNAKRISREMPTTISGVTIGT